MGSLPNRERPVAAGVNSKQRKTDGVGGGKPCPKCGFDGDYSEVDVVWHYREEEDEGLEKTVYYERCRRPVHIVLRLGDSK